MTSKSTTQLISGTFALIFVSIVVIYGVLQSQKTSTENSTNADTVTTVTSTPATNSTSSAPDQLITTPNTTSPTPPANSQTKYKDGSYTASSTYRTPSSPREPVTVKVSVQNDKITAVSSTSDSSDEESAAYKQLFNDAISGTLVGKSLDEKSPSRLNGSSLTSAGFNVALSAIRGEASK